VLLAMHLSRLKDRRGLTAQVSLGKLNNVRAARDRQCGTLLGASGSTLEYPVLRYASNLESVLACEGTEVVHRLAVGKGGYGLLGLPPCGDVGGHRTFVAIRPLSADSSDRSVYL
jgi:glutaryl-CoA dehydrogenase